MLKIFLLSGAALAALSGAAMAQSESELGVPPESVVVTATRTATPVDQVASAITVIDAVDIDQRQQRSLPDILRDVPGLKKKPSTSELLDWLKLLLHEDMPLDVLQNRDPTKAIPPLHGALLKNEQDVMLFERLAFMAKRQQGGGAPR